MGEPAIARAGALRFHGGRMTPVSPDPADSRYPAVLRKRLGDAPPAQVFARGNLDLLALPKTGVRLLHPLPPATPFE